MKTLKNIYSLIFVLIYCSTINSKTIKQDVEYWSKEIINIAEIINEKNNNFIRSVLELLNSLPFKPAEIFVRGKKLLELNDETLKMMRDIISDYKDSVDRLHDDGNNEEHYFTPKEPIALTDEEKQIPVKERIAKKYIGTIPNQIQDIIFYFSNHNRCLKNNLRLHNRLLLHGKSGTGKSYLVKVLAQELQLPFLTFTASFFSDKYFGESSRRIRKAFEVAKNYNKPLLIFIDEIDGLATKRTKYTNIENRATLLTLLTEMQDLHNNENIFIIAATNDFKILDVAIKDRFAGAICELKELSLEDKAKLFKKAFNDRGIQTSQKLTQRLAEVTRSWFFTKKKKRFSNRDIEYIVSTALIKHFEAYTQNPNTCKHLCAYIHDTMNAMEKKGRFALFKSAYCNGI